MIGQILIYFIGLVISINGQILYQNAGPIDPTQGSYLTGIDIYDEMTIQLDVVIHSFPPAQHPRYLVTNFFVKMLFIQA